MPLQYGVATIPIFPTTHNTIQYKCPTLHTQHMHIHYSIYTTTIIHNHHPHHPHPLYLSAIQQLQLHKPFHNPQAHHFTCTSYNQPKHSQKHFLYVNGCMGWGGAMVFVGAVEVFGSVRLSVVNGCMGWGGAMVFVGAVEVFGSVRLSVVNLCVLWGDCVCKFFCGGGGCVCCS